jgi:DNA-binding transcriptional regulator YhcF (GntR family)
MKQEKKNNYKAVIIDKLEDHPFGLSITEISNKTSFHRNTVSKYMSILEAEGKVNIKKIGAARIYTTKKRKYLRRSLVVSFIQSLLLSLKNKFPKEEQTFKEIGKEITKNFQFPIGDIYIDEFKKVRNSSNYREKLKLFQLFYNSFDFFQDDLEIDILELNDNKIVYRMRKCEFFNKSGKFKYFFNILCGITEGIYLQNLNLEIDCNLERIYFSEKDSYVDISLAIK